MNKILHRIQHHKGGQAVGIYSICSANPFVIRAALEHARDVDDFAVIESTSNQVNQDGGYTGMLPQDFCRLVYDLAEKVGLPRQRLVLGGDHLGPNCWQSMNAEPAMRKSEELIKQYISAGYRKIHLDCSMSCADDPIALDDEVIASRAARLCAVAESTWQCSGGEAPVYIVGSEVPVPGGAHEDLQQLAVTSCEAASLTIDTHKAALAKLGLDDVWSRIVGLVVQPGVEFDHSKVLDYQPDKAKRLSKLIEKEPGIVFEAHSTDYQTPDKLRRLVQGHFAILKVGPALTYALREAFWSLDQIEQEWLEDNQASQLRATMMRVMADSPEYWRYYYSGIGDRLALDQQYSLSDRIRYYWPQPEVSKAIRRLIENFKNYPPPLTLISQYLPAQYQAIRLGEINACVDDICSHKVREVLLSYSRACGVS